MLKNPIIKQAHEDPAMATVTTRYIGDRIIHTSAWDLAVDGTEPNPQSAGALDMMDSRKGGACTPGPQGDFLPWLSNQEIYVLIDRVTGAASGTTIETYDANAQGGAAPISSPDVYTLARSLTDDDNDWTDGEHVRNNRNNTPAELRKCNDDVMWDAHWGAATVYDYWMDEHQRASFDGAGADIYSYVHIGANYDNAFWNGTAMSYGDGSTFLPLIALDVCAHEIGHAVCTNTSDLVYARESGGMNEGFSDIWAAATEYYAINEIDGTLNFDGSNNGFRPFGIGEQIDADDKDALRFMDAPKLKNDPDTYEGQNFITANGCSPSLANDQCGVHSNSGVLNKWYYLMAVGSGAGSGPNGDFAGSDTGVFDHTDDEMNDNGEPYSVEGLGFVIADKIAFATEVMLTSNGTFAEARNATIQYCHATYGPCSNETKQATNAWHGVGVGAVHVEPCEAATISVGFVEPTGQITETAPGTDCEAANDVIVKVFTTAAITQDVSVDGLSTATEGKDFIISNKTIISSESVFQNVELTVSIMDDAIIEGTETIVLKFLAGSGATNDTYTLTINDDDVVPTIGDGSVVELVNENFTGGIPGDWVNDERVTDGPNSWVGGQANSFTTPSLLAAVVSALGAGTDNYDGNQGNNDLVLWTNAIDTRGFSSVNVEFDWGAGGERDASLIPDPFDYGSLVYTYDHADPAAGEMFSPGEFFLTNEPAVGTHANGTFNQTMDALDNSQFRLGFRWINDPLVGGTYSFAVDNVLITGTPRAIESNLEDNITERVDANTEVYFYSGQDGEILLNLKDGTEDMGCVSAKIEAEGAATAPLMDGLRTSKVVQVAGVSGSYTMTFFYTAAELAGFAGNETGLSIAQINGDITQTSPSFVMIDNAPTVEAIFHPTEAEQIIGYKYTTTALTGPGSFALTTATQEQSLAVELTNFDAAPRKQDIHLTWTTAKEVDNQGFELERRAENEQEFTTIGWIEGSGNTNSITTYHHIDRDVKANVTYFYRLKLIDNNSRIAFSDIRSATLKSEGTVINIAPNPTKDIVNVTFNNIDVVKNITLLDVSGKILNISTVNEVITPLDLSVYPDGIYFIRINTDNGSTVERVVKQ